jgi:hypothetical protein
MRAKHWEHFQQEWHSSLSGSAMGEANSLGFLFQVNRAGNALPLKPDLPRGGIIKRGKERP